MKRFPLLYDEAEKVARWLQEKLQPEKIILFGSVATAKENETSDIDLLVIKPGLNADRIKRTQEVYQLLWQRGEYPVGIDLIVVTPDELNQRLDAGDPFYQKLLAKGKTLCTAL